MLICHQDQAAALLGGIAVNETDFFGVVEERRRKLPGVRATLLCRKPRGEFKVCLSRAVLVRHRFSTLQGIQVLDVTIQPLESIKHEPTCISPTSSDDAASDRATIIKLENTDEVCYVLQILHHFAY